MRKILFGVLIAVALSAGAVVSGLRVHNHSSASLGGSALAPTSLDVLSGTLAASSSGTVAVNSTAGDTNYALDVQPQVAGDIGVRVRGQTSQTGNLQEWSAVSGSVLLRVDSGGGLLSAKACASGYTRATPNLCMADEPLTANTTPASCTQITLPAGTAKALLIRDLLQVTTNNAIAARSITYNVSSDAACAMGLTQALGRLGVTTREEVAVAAGNFLSTTEHQLTVRVPANGLLYHNFTHSGGAGSSATFHVTGYYD